MIAPKIAGGLADLTGNAAVAFHAGAAMSVAGILALGLFRRSRVVRAAVA